MSEHKRKATSEATSPTHKKPKSSYTTNGKHIDRKQHSKPSNGSKPSDVKSTIPNGQSSREAHAAQKQLKADRLASKPNADSIARSKKIWERLRIKSAVPKDERTKLVEELFGILTGKVKDFVFKHDSVRVVQCALKYANPVQRQQIAEELRGSYRELAESKYAKFLVAKLIVQDTGKKSGRKDGEEDMKVRDMVVPEFYGHVKRLIRHPEASWIMDDIYRSLATKDQKSRMLREWYGGEFAVPSLSKDQEKVTAELGEILKESPGKRGPIMSHLKEMTNQLVQKKTTGFTMLHDALLQYLLNCTPGSPEHREFLEMLRDDEEGDLFKNLAFTKSGSRVVCLALAWGSSKDRRNILRHYKTHVKLMAADAYAHVVLVTAFEVIDDTVTTAKAIVPELMCKDVEGEAKDQELLAMVMNINARIPMLCRMAEEFPKWLIDGPDLDIIKEVREIRKETSKKEASTRRLELNKAISQPLIDFIASQAEALVASSYGCQFVGEALVGATGEKENALQAMVDLVSHDNASELLSTSHAGRLYKMLVQGGRFDTATKTVVSCDPPLKFAELLYQKLRDDVDGGIENWAAGVNSWSIVAMMENDVFDFKDELTAYLRMHEETLSAPKDEKAANSGTKILLERISTGKTGGASNIKKTGPIKDGAKLDKDAPVKKAKRKAEK